MTSSLASPSRYYMTRHRSKAEAFCRALASRGLIRQSKWQPHAHLAQNTFRTYLRPATRTQPRRFVVAYQDWTLGAAVAKPSRFGGPAKRQERRLCVNGCARKNESKSGECHTCRSRRLYREDPAYRADRKARTRAARARKRDRMRSDPEFRAAMNAKRRAAAARKRERDRIAELKMLEAA